MKVVAIYEDISKAWIKKNDSINYSLVKTSILTARYWEKHTQTKINLRIMLTCV